MGKLKNFFKTLRSGVITGTANNDLSGIATYSQDGAQFGTDVLWFAPFQYPLMSLSVIVMFVFFVTSK